MKKGTFVDDLTGKLYHRKCVGNRANEFLFAFGFRDVIDAPR